MGEKKVTVMILKVDLQCDKCFKRVKKVLCQIPQIRDRIFDEKSNTVKITVLCCYPEAIRNKLCHKGKGAIKSIEIKEPEKPKPVPEKPPADPPKPKQVPPAASPPPAPAPAKPEEEAPPKKPATPPKSPEPAPKAPEPKPKSPEPAPKSPEPAPKPVEPAPYSVQRIPLFASDPIPTCCEQCYGGGSGGPCNYGYGPYGGGAPPVYYEGYYYGRMVGDNNNGYGPKRGRQAGGCAEFFSEENPAGCWIM